MKKLNVLSIFFLFLIQTTIIHAQGGDFEIETKNKDIDYIFLKGKDTLFCTITMIRRSQSQQICGIKYIDANKQEQMIGFDANIGSKAKAGILACQKVISLRADGYKLDFFPNAPSGPDHCEVLTSGDVTIWGEMALSLLVNKKGERVVYEKYVPAAKMIKYNDGKIQTGIDCDEAKKYFSKCSALSLPKKINYDNILFWAMKYNQAGCK